MSFRASHRRWATTTESGSLAGGRHLSTFTAFYDTNVLVPGSVRDLLMQLATTGAFRARWSDVILAELRRVLVDKHGQDESKYVRITTLMVAHANDPLVTGFEQSMDRLHLQDPDDRHVVAAAIHGRANVIVTYNLKHFPPDIIEPLGLSAQHPDEFISDLLDLHPQAVLDSVAAILGRLRNPPMTPDQLFEVYARNHLVHTARRLAVAFIS